MRTRVILNHRGGQLNLASPDRPGFPQRIRVGKPEAPAGPRATPRPEPPAARKFLIVILIRRKRPRLPDSLADWLANPKAGSIR